MHDCPFERFPFDILEADPERVVTDLADYMANYTGSQFEAIAARNRNPNTITADDLLAVTMLGVNVPAHAALWMLGDGAAQIMRLLTEIGPDRDVATVAPEDLADGSPASALFAMFRAARWGANYGGMGPTTTSKLLAAKRPRLLAVHDSRIKALLYPSGRLKSTWDSWRKELVDQPDALRRLRDLAVESASPAANLSDLRLLDVALWMHSRRTQPHVHDDAEEP